MTSSEIRQVVLELQAKTVEAEERAWERLKPLGIEVVPYLLEAYPKFRGWQGRASLVFHSIRFARLSEDAFQLGVLALDDPSNVVRSRACALLAYSLRMDAVAHLHRLREHADARTVEDAKAAIDAIEHQNHHWFEDRTHSGQVIWVVNEEDRET